MANGLNQVHLIGNLGNDPEVKYTQGGKAVARLSVATTETWKDKDGNKQERTEWHRVVAFDKLGEICGEYLRKGSSVYIGGAIKYGKYTGSDGVEKYSTDIIAKEMRMLGGKPEGERASRPQRQESAPQRQAPPSDDFADDDIPF